MRPIQYASNTASHDVAFAPAAPSRPSWGSRALSSMTSAVLVAVGTFTIFWLLANVTALLMVRG